MTLKAKASVFWEWPLRPAGTDHSYLLVVFKKKKKLIFVCCCWVFLCCFCFVFLKKNNNLQALCGLSLKSWLSCLWSYYNFQYNFACGCVFPQRHTCILCSDQRRRGGCWLPQASLLLKKEECMEGGGTGEEGKMLVNDDYSLYCWQT